MAQVVLCFLYFFSLPLLFCAGLVSFWWTEITLLLQFSEKYFKYNVGFVVVVSSA